MTSRSKSILKYLLAVILLLIILHNTEIGKIAGYFQHISPLNLILALLLVTLAQIAAAMRMRYFFAASSFHLSTGFSIILFYVGAFYNFLLPGGIGGDAYKVMIARKRLEMPTMQGIRIMVADRASGLCVLMLILFAALYFVDLSSALPYANLLIIAAMLITLITYLAGCKILLKQSPRIMLISLPYSLATQSLWVLTIATLWQSLGNGNNFIEYVALYAAASIASLLPVSVGGLGIKEMTYFYGAMLFRNYCHIPVDGELGVTLSLCVFALSFIGALPGILWLSKVTHMHVSRVSLPHAP
jgi:uncharacterized membrane protein YbhN (UPF0104 family)